LRRRASGAIARRLNWAVEPVSSSRQVLHCDEVHPLAVATVELLALGHPLLLAENAVADGERRGQLARVGDAPDLDAHEPSAYRRTSRSRAATVE
jgi:hypothetical protein